MHALGFEAVQINLQQAEVGYGFAQQASLGIYAELARELAVRQLKVVGIHALFLTGPQVFSQDARSELMAAQVKIAQTLHATVLTVHPADIFTSEEALQAYAKQTGAKRAKPPLLPGMRDLQRSLAEEGITLALENIKYWQASRGTNDVQVMARLAKALDCRVALDVRRSLCSASLERWVELLGDRIIELHLHDEKAGSEHHPPLALDWRAMIPILKRTAAQVCILEAAAEPGHGAIKMSREYIERLWSL